MGVLKKRKRKPLSLVAFVSHPATDIVVMVLILVSVVLLVIEEMVTLPINSPIPVVSDLITTLFAGELCIRYIVAKKKMRFFRRYWTDILAVLPMLRPLRFFRVFRFFRLLRLFRLFQLGMLLDRRVSMLRGILRVNFYFLWALLVVTGITVVGGGVMVFLFEAGSERFPDLRASMWWAVYTVIAGEPVGGMPDSTQGRLLLAAMMLGGMTLFAVFTGIVSATMMNRLRGTDRLGEYDIEELESHVVVCGWNAGVRPLLSELAVDEELRGMPIVLVNEVEEMPDLNDTGIRSDLIYTLTGDYTQLAVLERAGVKRAARAVVMADDVRTREYSDRDARSVLAALTIERMNPEIYCVVELMNQDNQAHLGVAGVEAVIMRNDLSGRALAAACRHPELMAVMMNLLTLRKGETMHRFPGPSEPVPFGELLPLVKKEYDALLIGVEREGASMINPDQTLLVQPSDWLIVIGGPLEP